MYTIVCLSLMDLLAFSNIVFPDDVANWSFVLFCVILGESTNSSDKLTHGPHEENELFRDVKNWSKEDVKCLFDIRMKKETKFNGNKVHKSLWEIISKELSTFGVTASSTHCSNKWKAMKREYQKTVDNNSRTGAEKKTCPFYEEFNELYGNKSGTCTRPTYVMSSTCNSG